MSTLPTTPRGRRTRAAIVDAAAALFYSQGASATSLDEVIARAGVGKSQLYHYFSGRPDLTRAVIERQLDRVLGAQSKLGEITDLNGLRAWAEQVVALHRGPDGALACPVGSLAAEVDRDPELRPSAAAAFAAWAQPLHEAIQRLQAAGIVDPTADADRLALRLLAAVQGGLLLAHSLQDDLVLEDSLAAAIDQIAAVRH